MGLPVEMPWIFQSCVENLKKSDFVQLNYSILKSNLQPWSPGTCARPVVISAVVKGLGFCEDFV